MGFFRRCKGLEQRRGNSAFGLLVLFFSPKQFVIQHFSDPSEDIFMECLVTPAWLCRSECSFAPLGKCLLGGNGKWNFSFHFSFHELDRI